MLLNKTDLVSEQDLARVEQRIRSINRTAKVFRTRAATLPIERVLDVGAFDLDRALAVDKGFLEPEYPFEWAGVVEFSAGKVQIRTGADGAHEHHHHGTAMTGTAVTNRPSRARGRARRRHERHDAPATSMARTTTRTRIRTATATSPTVISITRVSISRSSACSRRARTS